MSASILAISAIISFACAITYPQTADAKNASAASVKDVRIPFRDARKNGPNSTRFAAGQFSRDAPTIVLFGMSPARWPLVRDAIKQAVFNGFPVNGVFMGSTDQPPSLEIFADGQHVINRDKLHQEFEGIIEGLRPRPELIAMAKAMFSDISEQRLLSAKQQASKVKSDIKKLDARISGLLDRIVDAQSDTVVGAYEKRITEMEREKQVLLANSENMVPSKPTFERSFRTAILFLANPQKLWTHGNLTAKRTLLKLAFSDKLTFDREIGLRTAQATLPFRVFGSSRPQCKMAHSEGVFTNQILEELAGWEKILQHTSLSQTFDPDELEGEDEDAPRDRRLATVRRRRRRS